MVSASPLPRTRTEHVAGGPGQEMAACPAELPRHHDHVFTLAKLRLRAARAGVDAHSSKRGRWAR